MGLFPEMCRFALVRNSTTPRVSCTLSTVVVCDDCGEESAHGAGETDMCVCGTTAPFPRLTILLRAPSSAALPPSRRQVRVMKAMVSLFQGESTATCTEDHEAKSRVIASTTQTCHLDAYGYGLAVHHLRHDDRVAVFCQHPRSKQKARRARSHKLDCRRDLRRGLRF